MKGSLLAEGLPGTIGPADLQAASGRAPVLVLLCAGGPEPALGGLSVRHGTSQCLLALSHQPAP